MLACVGDLGLWALLFTLLGGIGGGFINSVAGGGTLVSFPVLTAVGIPALDANITNAVALAPGYAGGTYAQRDDFAGRRDLARALAVTSILGGITGAVLLLLTGEDAETPGINGAILPRSRSPAGAVNLIDVDSLDRALVHVVEHGGVILHARTIVPGVGSIAYCRDPEGNAFGLIERSPTAS